MVTHTLVAAAITLQFPGATTGLVKEFRVELFPVLRTSR